MKKLVLILYIFVHVEINGQNYSVINDTITAGSVGEALNQIYGLLPKSHYPTGYLLNKTCFESKFAYADGLLSDSSFNMLEWYFLQNIIRSSYYRPDSIIGYPTIDSLKNIYISENNILPWGIINMNVNYIRDSALTKGSLAVNNHRFIENDSNVANIYSTKRLFCATPLNLEILTLTPKFIITPQNIFSNSNDALSKIEVNLDDGLNFRKVEINVPFYSIYPNGGFKHFICRLIFNNGDTLYSRSELEVIDQDALLRTSGHSYTNYDDIYKIYPGIPNLGTYPPEFTPPFQQQPNNSGAKFAEVGVWYGCGNTVKKIRKPFVIFAGYNPTNGKSLSYNGHAPWYNDALGAALALPGWRGPLYETYNGFFTDASKNANGGQSFGSNGNNFFDKVRSEGYDILIVRFHDGIGFLQNTAWLASLVLKEINQNITNETYGITNPGADIDPEAQGYPNTTIIKKAKHELVVAGYSAGALCTRMGLLLMEYEHQNDPCNTKKKSHRTKIWIGFDCENQGSNTPIGQQMMMDFIASVWAYPASTADVANSLICKTANDLLSHNGVATQNTLYHTGNMYYSGNSTWNIGHHYDFDNYFNDLSIITPSNHPNNLAGYPKNCYRIAVSQGNANGIGQLISSDIKLINNESPTFLCNPLMAPLYFSFGSGNPLVSTTPYRKANGRVLTSWNNNAFTCKFGLSVRTLAFSWHVNIGHWKYHDNNYITDADFGTYRSYDEAPGSTLPSHILLGEKLPMSYRNAAINAITYCNSVDWNDFQHGFSPTVSGLNLHLPNQNSLPRYPNLSLIPGNIIGGMNLMQQNKYGNIFDPSPHNDFGFPHLTYPTNHYDYTPYDAIWAHGDNISTTNYDDNLIHVEDPSPYIGEFLTEEIAPQTLYLSNRTIQGELYSCSTGLVREKYYADFEARNSVLAGNQTIYEHNQNSPYKRVRTSQGDFVVDDGAVVSMRANNYDGYSSVVLGAGFSAKQGSIFRAYVYKDPNMCVPFNYNNTRLLNSDNQKPSAPIKKDRPIFRKTSTNQVQGGNHQETFAIDVYPNPTDGCIYYSINSIGNFKYYIRDVIGKVIESGVLNMMNPKLDISQYKAGVYFITITSNKINQTDRIILQ